MDKKVLRYHMKWRVWFQEYMPPGGTPGGGGASMVENPPPRQPASHANLVRLYWQSEGNAGEYDVPPAFKRDEEFPILGYPDWPVGKPTPGTSCTGDCPNGDDCDCHHEIV